jgi:hypothetical protein
VPRLIECLEDPSRAEAAAGALELLLGDAPIAPNGAATAADDVAGADRTSSRDASAWNAIAQPVLGRFSRELRLRAGTVATAAVTIELLERKVGFPLRLRAYLARELSVRWALPRTVDVDALLREQSAALGALSRLPVAAGASAWD